jgi:hypothetical protein
MLSSPNPQISSSIHPTALSLASFSFTSFTSFTSLSSPFRFTQTLPTFSTPSKHHTRTNARNSFPFMRLLHSSLFTHIPRRHLPSIRLFHSGPLFQLNPIPLAPLNPFLVHPEPRRATLSPRVEPRGTDSSQLTENPATLSPFPATLTHPVTSNSFICHSYKNAGVGYPLVPRLLCATSASSAPQRPLRCLFSFSCSSGRTVPPRRLDDPVSLRRYLLTSLLRLSFLP